MRIKSFNLYQTLKNIIILFYVIIVRRIVFLTCYNILFNNKFITTDKFESLISIVYGRTINFFIIKETFFSYFEEVQIFTIIILTLLSSILNLY